MADTIDLQIVAENELLDLADPVSACVKIRRIVLSNSRITRLAHPDTEVGGHALHVLIGTDKVQVTRAEDPKKFLVAVFFTLSASRKDDPEAEPVGTIDATFSLSYLLDTDEHIGDENLEAFAKINGVFNAWPYWREFVQNSTSRLGLPAVTVPIFRF